MTTKILICISLFYIITIQAEEECIFPSLSNDPTILETNYGKIKGLCNKISIVDPDEPNKVGYAMTWYSIPFAKPPINELRFRKPVEPEVWNDVKDGTVKSNICMQPPQMRLSKFGVSEDCLYLNIFAPATLFNSTTSNEKLPIYFYIHGGRFEMGSGLGDELDSKVLVSLTNIIVVTINYRLGPFGFLYFDDSDLSGNHGFLDQHMALKWVYENADHFKGDRNRITMGGFSAGSFSSSFHLIYPPSWPYFRNTIMESGVLLYSTMTFLPLDEATRRARDIFSLVDCGNDSNSDSNPNKILECVRNIDASKFLNISNDYYKNTILQGNNYALELTPLVRLVQNGQEFKQSIKTSFERGNFKNNNILIGFTPNEAWFLIASSDILKSKNNSFINSTDFRYFLEKYFYYFPTYPYPSGGCFLNEVITEFTKDSNKNESSNYLENLIQIMSEEIFICPMLDLSRIYSKKNNVFTFSFEQSKSQPNHSPEYGVGHGDQLDFVFAKALQSNQASKFTDDERRFTKKVIKYWTNFMKYNDPNIYDDTETSFNPYWPTFITEISFDTFKPDKDFLNSYLSLKSNLTIPSNDLSFRHCDFWKKYNTFPIIS